MAKRKQRLFEVRHPFFRPFWRRLLVSGLCMGWTMFELSNGETLWAMVFGACAVHLFLQFFVFFDPVDYEPPTESDDR
jgi:hypothetical protein